MRKRILLLADLHGNFPALEAIDRAVDCTSFDHIVNCGDSLVYAPFPSETMRWLQQQQVLSIRGNTDNKVVEILCGNIPKKPKKEEKRIMYTSTAASLDEQGLRQLLATPETAQLVLAEGRDDTHGDLILGIYHGSPADPEEFLFADTPDSRFAELAGTVHCRLVVTGHSHSPYHKIVAGVHFINPGSAGRMFDGDPRASCAIVDIAGDNIAVHHLRIDYDIERVAGELARQHLPDIYATMFRQGRKLN
jgi:predicted phosphodiesterase